MNVKQYIGRDNISKLLLKSDGIATNLSEITRVDLISEKLTISNTAGNAFPIKWIGTDATGEIQIQLKDVSVSPGFYDMDLIVYEDTFYPDGFVWGNFILEVREA